MARLFLTGASGYLGGEVLYQLSRLPAKHTIRCLVRTEDKATQIEKATQNTETVLGDLDDTTLIENESKAADVVFHLASTKHEASSRAIIKGLSDSSRKASGHYLQIGGASLLAGQQIKDKAFGEYTRKYDDVEDLDAVKAIIKSSPARVVDNLIFDTKDVKTALVAGPIIYGKGRGPVNTKTIQGPAIAEYALKHDGEAFQIGEGKNVWSTVHVADVGRVFVLLLEAALEGKEGLWNEYGLYFPENGSTSFGDFAQHISKAVGERKGISGSVKSMSAQEVDEIVPHGSIILGTTAHTSSSRANKYLGWKPTEVSLSEDIPIMVKALST